MVAEYDDHLFDRLADGEVPIAEKAELLASFDQQPGAWRRCAIALLEAQSWRRALSPVVAEPTPPVAEIVCSTRPARAWTMIRSWALAAGVLVALGAGWLAGWSSADRISPPLAIEPAAAPSAPTIASTTAPGINHPAAPAVASQPPNMLPANPLANSSLVVGPWQPVGIVVDHGNGSLSELPLPGHAPRDDQARWLARQPENVVEALRQLGADLQLQRELPVRSQAQIGWPSLDVNHSDARDERSGVRAIDILQPVGREASFAPRVRAPVGMPTIRPMNEAPPSFR